MSSLNPVCNLSWECSRIPQVSKYSNSNAPDSPVFSRVPGMMIGGKPGSDRLVAGGGHQLHPGEWGCARCQSPAPSVNGTQEVAKEVTSSTPSLEGPGQLKSQEHSWLE